MGAGRGWAGASAMWWCQVHRWWTRGLEPAAPQQLVGGCPMYNCHCSPASCAAGTAMGKEAQVLCLPPPATRGLSGAAVSAAGRPGLQAPTPLVPRFCLFSVLQSNHLSFFFFSYLMLGQEGTPEIMQDNYLCVELSTQHRRLAFLAPTL